MSTKGWGSPAPRIDAAQGLVSLAAREDCPEPEILLGLIETLSQDPAPQVRYQIARGLSRLALADADLATGIAERIAAGDRSRAVAAAMLASLPALTRENLGRRRQIAEMLFAVNPDGPGSKELRGRAIALISDLYVAHGDNEAGEFLRRELLNAVTEDQTLVHGAVGRLRETMSWGSDEPEPTEIRGRAIGLVAELLGRALERFAEIQAVLRERAKPPDEDDPELLRGRTAAQVIDSIATEVYFASGAHIRQGEEESRLNPERRKRFYREAGGLLGTLTAVVVPSATHHIVETLESFVEFDPEGVFVLLARTFESGRAGAYQTDPMAEKHVVGLIERYLAEYRTLLQSDPRAATCADRGARHLRRSRLAARASDYLRVA